MNAKNFGLVMTSLLSVHTPYVRPSVRNSTMLMRLCLFGGKLHGEIVWQGAFTTEMLKNKKHKDNLYVFVGYVDKRGKKRKREKKKTKKRRRLSKVQRGRERRIAS